MTKTISEEQLAANRSNAKKSSGPRTEEGKTEASYNALKHGLTAERVLMRDESEEDFEAYRGDLFAHFAPKGMLEGQLVECVATLLWRLKRVPEFVSSLFQRMEHYEYEKEDFDPKPHRYNPRSLKRVVEAIEMAERKEDKVAVAEQKGNVERTAGRAHA